MVSGIYWSVGARAVNEDSLALEQALTERGEVILAVIADGISSLEKGETASGYVCECMVSWFYNHAIKGRKYSKRRLIRSLNRQVYDCFETMQRACRTEGIKMGTTCCMVVILGRRYVVMNLGDSSAVLWNKSLWRFGVNADRGKFLSVKDVNLSGQLTKAVNSVRYEKPDIKTGKLPARWGLLLCSDGFAERFTTEELTQMLYMSGEITPSVIDRRLAKIGSEAEHRGATDNRCAIYMTNCRYERRLYECFGRKIQNR